MNSLKFGDRWWFGWKHTIYLFFFCKPADDTLVAVINRCLEVSEVVPWYNTVDCLLRTELLLPALNNLPISETTKTSQESKQRHLRIFFPHPDWSEHPWESTRGFTFTLKGQYELALNCTRTKTNRLPASPQLGTTVSLNPCQSYLDVKQHFFHDGTPQAPSLLLLFMLYPAHFLLKWHKSHFSGI